MGTRSYAEAVANILDPSRKFFSRRVLSRDELIDPRSKSLSLRCVCVCVCLCVCVCVCVCVGGVGWGGGGLCVCGFPCMGGLCVSVCVIHKGQVQKHSVGCLLCKMFRPKLDSMVLSKARLTTCGWPQCQLWL